MLYFICLTISILFMLIAIMLNIFIKEFLGWAGEHWTKKALKELPSDYIVLNDLFIRSSINTHQIDHVVVSKYGVFCIETKQYNGFIVGSKYDKYWTRYIGKKKIYYENPIRQNYGHVKALEDVLQIDENKIFNIVCIPSGAKLRIDHDGELVRYGNIVKRIESHKEILIDNVDEIVNKLNYNNITDKSLRKEHIKKIKEKIKQEYK